MTRWPFYILHTHGELKALHLLLLLHSHIQQSEQVSRITVHIFTPLQLATSKVSSRKTGFLGKLCSHRCICFTPNKNMFHQKRTGNACLFEGQDTWLCGEPSKPRSCSFHFVFLNTFSISSNLNTPLPGKVKSPFCFKVNAEAPAQNCPCFPS